MLQRLCPFSACNFHWFLLVLSLSLLTACSTPDVSAPEDGRTYRRIGYVFRGNSTSSSPLGISPQSARQLTHVNYAFANVTEEGRVVFEAPRVDSTHLAQLTSLRESANPDLDILLSIGGWVWSDYFSNAALTDSSRARFARSAVGLLKKHDLDGLDLDWEYPGQPGEDNVYRPEDKKNFTLLLRTVRQRLNELAEQQGHDEPYLLTIAAGASPKYIEHTNMAAVQEQLDFVNLMTYDFHGSWTDHTGHHANLHPPTRPDTVRRAGAITVDLFLDAGVPSRKLVLGVPFYGRGWRDVKRKHNGLYQPYSESIGGLSYDTLAHHFVDQRGFVRHWDEEAKAPYLWNPGSAVVITYEDTASLRVKAEFIKSRDLGGAMYWEHSEDDGTLLNTLYEGLR